MNNVETKNLNGVILDNKNLNKGTERGKKALVQSFKNLGAGRSILLDKNNRVIAGNHSVKTALELGIENVIVVETDGTQLVAVKRNDVDIDSSKGRELAIADNRTSELNLEWDSDVLLELGDSVDLSLYWDESEIDDLLSSAAPTFTGGLTDEDDVPEAPKVARAKLGEMYQLGRHRLMCGDSTKAENVERLMGGVKADMVFTSPPYNVGKSAALLNNSHFEDSKYKNYDDNKTQKDYFDLLVSFSRTWLNHCKVLAVNLQQLAGNKIALIDYLATFKHHFIDVAIWNKTNPAPATASNVMTSQFEFIYFLSPQEFPTRSIPSADFKGTVNNVYTSPVNSGNPYSSLHAATFPVHFAEWALTSFTVDNSIIGDSFGGTGTTLIACEKTNRSCYVMELEPLYIDVIIERWENYTGQKAKRLE